MSAARSHAHPFVIRILAAFLVLGMAAPAFRVFLVSNSKAAAASPTVAGAAPVVAEAPDPALVNAATATLEAMLAALPTGYDEVERQTSGATAPWGAPVAGDCRAVLDVPTPDAQVASLHVARLGGLPEVASAAAVFPSVSEAEAALGSVDPTSAAGRCWHEGLVRGLLGGDDPVDGVRVADADLVKGRACSCERRVAAVTARYIVETGADPITVYVEAVQVDATVMLVTTQVPGDPSDDLPNQIRQDLLVAGARHLAGNLAGQEPAPGAATTEAVS